VIRAPLSPGGSLSHLRKRPDLLRSFMDKTELTNAA
jgi:hypothetical protein